MYQCSKSSLSERPLRNWIYFFQNERRARNGFYDTEKPRDFFRERRFPRTKLARKQNEGCRVLYGARENLAQKLLRKDVQFFQALYFPLGNLGDFVGFSKHSFILPPSRPWRKLIIFIKKAPTEQSGALQITNFCFTKTESLHFAQVQWILFPPRCHILRLSEDPPCWEVSLLLFLSKEFLFHRVKIRKSLLTQ